MKILLSLLISVPWIEYVLVKKSFGGIHAKKHATVILLGVTAKNVIPRANVPAKMDTQI